MTILPGSLDYLYHNGILPSIPYEAYEMTPMTASGRAQMAGMGMGLRESVIPPNYNNIQTPQNTDLFLKNENSSSKIPEKKSILPSWLKEVMAAGIMVLTLGCLFKGILKKK